MKPLTLRLLSVGTRFRLIRTGEVFQLKGHNRSPLGGYQYIVFNEATNKMGSLAHSVQVKPILRSVQDLAQTCSGDTFVTQQGHRYSMGEKSVIALERSACPMVLVFDERDPWNTSTIRVNSRALKPSPMRYFHGEIPRQ